MKPTVKNWIGRILALVTVLFLGFHAVPATAVAQDAAAWQRLQEQKIRRQQLLNARFTKLIAQARAQQAQIERWHQLHSGKAVAHAKNNLPKDKVQVATQYTR